MDVLPSLFLHPWTLLATQIILTSLTVGFTKPPSSIRYAMVILMTCVMAAYISIARKFVDNTFQVSWGGSQAVLAVYQYVDVAIVNRWDFEYSGPEPRGKAKKSSSPYGNYTLCSRLSFGIYAAFSFRNCGTAFETHGVKPFCRKNPSFVPQRKRFIVSTALHLVVCYLALDALTSLGDPGKQELLFSASRIPLLSRIGEITFQESIERLTCSFVFWLVNYLVLTTSVSAISLVMVATNLSSVVWWKPLFNIDSGFPFTIRRFWSNFWHLSVRSRILSPSTYIVYNLLRLPHRSILSRYMVLVLTFVFSAGFHGLGDVSCGISLSETGAWSFFLVQAAAVILEDLVQHLWKKFLPTAEKKVTRWQIWVGRLWVFMLMYWCTPFYAYPVTSHNGNGLIVPFSVLRLII